MNNINILLLLIIITLMICYYNLNSYKKNIEYFNNKLN
jgi:hypothetical protein